MSMFFKHVCTQFNSNNWAQQSVFMLDSNLKQNMHFASSTTMIFLNPLNIVIDRMIEKMETATARSVRNGGEATSLTALAVGNEGVETGATARGVAKQKF